MTYFYGPTHATTKRNGTRVFCKKCQQEQAFFRNNCLVCGTAFVKQMKGTGAPRTFADQQKAGRRAASIRDDRAAYWKRQAEESRKKFEGGK